MSSSPARLDDESTGPVPLGDLGAIVIIIDNIIVIIINTATISDLGARELMVSGTDRHEDVSPSPLLFLAISYSTMLSVVGLVGNYNVHCTAWYTPPPLPSSLILVYQINHLNNLNHLCPLFPVP